MPAKNATVNYCEKLKAATDEIFVSKISQDNQIFKQITN